MVEHDLEHAKEHDAERVKEAKIVKYLHERIQLELPPALLQNEIRRALAEIVQRNRERGVTDEMLKEKEKELIDAAAGMAAHRLKTNFILHRIAELEKIQVTKEDLDLRVRQEAARYDISAEKMRKELQQKNALDDVAEQLLLGKTLDFLKANVSIELTKEPSVKEEKT
jgi:trigger factor